MMRRILKFPSSIWDIGNHFHNISSGTLNNSNLFRIAHFSKFSRKVKGSKSDEVHDKHRSIFNEIVEILGSGDVFLYSSSSSEAQGNIAEISYCTQGVRHNAKLNNVTLGDVDVSPLVQKVTEIVRGENESLSMEQQLEKLDIEFNVEIVDKVLKRCFKVPHLALRFFNWGKLGNRFDHTTETYNTMIYIAGQAKDFDLVYKLLEEMKESSCEMDIKTWTILISNYGKAKLVNKALNVFQNMTRSGLKPDMESYKQMLSILCHGGKVDIAMEFYKEMIDEEMVIDTSLHKLLMTTLGQSGNIIGVHFVAENMMKSGKIPDSQVYGYMIKSLCISGRIRETLELIRDLKHRNVSIESENFETLVKGFVRADRIEDAMEIINIMKKKGSVDEKIYSLIINGYLRRQDVSRAFDLFVSLKGSSYVPTIQTYTELLQGLYRFGFFEKASDLYKEMMENGVEIDSVAMTAIVAGLIQAKSISKAWEVLEKMEEKGIKATNKSYTVFVKELCKASQTDEIIHLLRKMISSKANIGDDLFLRVISHLERNSEQELIETVKQMQKRAYKFDEIHLEKQLESVPITNQTEEQGRIDSVSMHSPLTLYKETDLSEICQILSSSDQFLTESSAINFTPELVLAVLNKFKQNGNVALRFFSWVGNREGYTHTSETYNAAIKIAGSGKDYCEMRNLFNEMKRNGYPIQPDTWTIMIMQYGRKGMTEIALNLFHEMKTSGCKPNATTYKYLIISLCGQKGRKVDEASIRFREMVRLGFIPDKELVEKYLDCLCEVGNLPDARICMESLRTVGGYYKVPLTYSLFIRSLCRVGRLEEALSVLNEVESDKKQHKHKHKHVVDGYVYGSLVHAMLGKGRVEEALDKVDYMRGIGIKPNVHVYTCLIVYFFKTKNAGKAVETFVKMKEEGCEATVVTYTAVICGYLNCGEVNEGLGLFERMKREGVYPDFRCYSRVIDCLCKMGKSEVGLFMISEMMGSGIVPSDVNFRTVFYGLNREGKRDLASIVLHKKKDVKAKRIFTN